jgi:FKBP-type peptidyl-prolyl cis-trans isomerase FkpA
VKTGEGAKPTDEDVALVGYRGTLTDGTVFDAKDRAPFPVAQVVPGFSEALKLMQRGGSYRLCIPPKLGYGDKVPAGGPIPANAVLRFSVEMLDFKSMADVQAQMMQLRQQQQRTGQTPSGPAPQPQATPGN